MGFTPVFSGSVIYPADTTYISLTTAVDVDLSWPVEQQIGGNIVADIIDVNATASGVDINIPDARQATTGFTSLVNNVGANTITIKDATGGTIMTVASGEAWEFYLHDNSTEAGSWRIFQYGAGVSSANAAALAGAGLKAITTALNVKMDVSAKSANYAIVNADRAKVINWTDGVGDFTLPNPATVGADWFVVIRNSGSGTVTVTPAAGLIDAATELVFEPTNSAIVVTDGTNYFTIGFGQAINSVFDFISINVAGTGNFVLAGVQLNRVSYEFTGLLTGNRNIIVPAFVQQYWVDNQTTGAFTLTVKTLAGTGIVVPAGQRAILYCDGVDVLDAETRVVTTPVTIADGGTGATTAAGARTNLDVPPNSRDIIAGAGLTGGGNLSADRTLNVGAGTGITVNANDVALDTANTRNVDHASVSILAGTGLTGGGDITTSRTLNVNQGFAFTWTVSQTYTPAAGNGIVVNAFTGENGIVINGAAGAGNSFGFSVLAGTNNTDKAVSIRDKTGATNFLSIFGDGGSVFGAATGGDQGLGTINADGIFVDGNPVTAITDQNLVTDGGVDFANSIQIRWGSFHVGNYPAGVNTHAFTFDTPFTNAVLHIMTSAEDPLECDTFTGYANATVNGFDFTYQESAPAVQDATLHYMAIGF